MKLHELKCWPEPFQALWDYAKTFEYRRDDRDFELGDRLYIREWDPKKEERTGRTIVRDVTYILRGPDFGVPKGYVVMGLR